MSCGSRPTPSRRETSSRCASFGRWRISSLTRAQAQLAAGPSGAMEAKGSTGALDNVIESGPDQAPPQYRDKVAEYYKALNGAL